MAGSSKDVDGESACPVDHNSRAAWLAAHGGQAPHPGMSTNTDATTSTATQEKAATQARLSPVRQISTIPRAMHADEGRKNSTHSLPSNAEQETGASQSGNWIYPSEEMFFNAMKRKQWDPKAADMNVVVPIHNAVNEKAWAQIKQWEKGMGSDKCGGPKLASFSGDSKALTPRARWNSIWGYKPPFDRHDWVIDRCGQKVEYVIDFYSGTPSSDGKPSFFLDVRPKLNSVEGIRMRMLRALGL